MDPEYTPVIGIVAFIVIAVGAVVLSRKSAQVKKKDDDANAEREAAIKKGVEDGIINKFGEPLCVVCGQVATRPTVRTGTSWVDQVPVLRTMNRLYAMTPRYKVVDDWQSGPRLCAAHRRAADHRLDQMHARMRSEHAQFNANQQQKVAMLDQGGLEQLLREDTEEIQRQIGLRGTVRRTLDSAAGLTEGEADAVHVLPVRSTDTTEEDPNDG